MYCQMGLQVSINTIHYQISATTSGSVTDQEATRYFETKAQPDMSAWLADVAKFLGCRGQIIEPTRKPFVSSTLLAGFGDQVAEPLPTQAALILDKLTNYTTEGARGRLFLPFWTEAANDASGVPNAAAIALANNFANDMLVSQVVVGAGGSATFVPVINSKAHGTAKPITAWKIRTKWGTHRSRSQINKPDNFSPDL